MTSGSSAGQLAGLLSSEPLCSNRMAALIYRCPATGLNVQAWFADELTHREGEYYETMTCPACRLVHLVSPRTGRVLAPRDE
jgi:hypothetical protein